MDKLWIWMLPIVFLAMVLITIGFTVPGALIYMMIITLSIMVLAIIIALLVIAIEYNRKSKF